MSRVLRAFGALVVLVGLMVGVPLLLVQIAGWPLPTKMPDWSNASTMMQQGNIEASTVIKVLACVVWVAWAITAWTVVWEAIVNVPRMLKGRRHEPTPMAPASLSKGIGWLFTVLLATTTVSSTAHAAPSLASDPGLDDGWADAELSVDSADTSSHAEAAVGPAFADSYAAPASEVWLTDDEDSLWSIAQQSGVTIDEVLAENPSLSATTAVEPGMRINLPEGVDVPENHRVVDEAATEPGPAPTGEQSGAESATKRTYVVQDNDGMFSVAEALLGDGTRHIEMSELAIGQEVAPGVIFTADIHVIHPNWVFTYDPAAPTSEPADAAPLAPAEATHTVVAGDSLSSIAEAMTGDADRWVELWDLNQGRTMNDGRVLDDPNLILPGWELVLTASVAEPAPPIEVVEAPPTGSPDEAPTELEATDAPETPLEGDSDESEADDSFDTGATTDATDPEVVPSVRVDVPTPAVVPSQTGSGTPLPPPPPPNVASSSTSDTADAVAQSDWQRSVWAQIAAGALLLAGLGVMVRRLRLRRLARLETGRRLVEPPSAAAGTELAVTRAPESMAELTTLRGLMQSLTPYAGEQADPPPVRAVQIGEERVEVLFASPAPLPPKGWSTIDGGKSWTHRFDDSPIPSRQLLTPALVTIGIRTDDGEDEVLLDLETAASVSIGGDHDAAIGLARSMALEVATYPLGVPMDLCLIGLHVDGTEVCDRVWPDTTLQRAIRVTRQTLDRIGAQGAASVVAARADLDEDEGTLDPTVFIVNVASISEADRPLLDELVDICQPSTGVAVVLVGEHLNANEQIVLDEGSLASWAGVELQSPNVTLEAAAEAAVMLDHAANAESEPLEPGDFMVELLETSDAASDNGSEEEVFDDSADVVDVFLIPNDDHDPVEEYVYTPPAHDLLLRVMNWVKVEPIDLTFDETELLAVLTCLRGHTDVHIDLINDLIAPNRQAKTIANRLGKLRSRLGVGSDGNDLLPQTGTAGRGRSVTFTISNLVITDIDLLEHRLHTAHTLGSTDALRVLRDGLDLLQGPMFRARKGFDAWPHSEGVIVGMTSIITNYATRLIELAVEVDDIPLVVRTTALAGLVLDNPVAEVPFRQIEEEFAEACGDEHLIASVAAAHKRLRDYLKDEDSLATP